MKIVIGSDHGGFEYKEQIIEYLEAQGHDVNNQGTYSLESCDYPDYAEKVANVVAAGDVDFGILICGTGIGVSLAANKVNGIRAAVTPNVDYGRLAKQHNNANIICTSGRFMTLQENIDTIEAYMNAEFAGEHPQNDSDLRHKRRVEKIMEIEKRNRHC